MATFTGQHAELLEAREKTMFFKGFSMQDQKWPMLFQSKRSNKAYEDRMRVAGLGTYATKPEGTPVPYDDPVSGARVRTVHSTFALGWRVTMEMMDDELFGIMDQMSSDLGDSARDHQERLVWSLINDGHAAATYTGLEGEALFLTTHTLLKTGGTESNTLSPAVALSITGLEAIMDMIATTTSDEGRFQNLEGSKLLYHPTLAHRAMELLETEFQVDSANNNRSTVHSTRSGITPVADRGVPYLTNTDGWSVHGPPGRNSLVYNDRKVLSFDQTGDPETFDLKHTGHYRASVMFSEWRNNFGSNF